MLRDRLLRWIGKTTHRYWWLILLFAAVTVVLCILAIRSLEITTGYVDLLPQEHPEVKNYFKVLEEFGGTDYLVVLIEDSNEEQVHRAVDDMAGRLDDTGEFDYVQYKVDLQQFTRYGLLYLDIDTLKRIDLLLSERKLEELTELAGSFAMLREELASSFGPGINVDEQGYFTSQEGNAGLLIAKPSFTAGDTEKIRPFGEQMEEIAREVERSNPGCEVWLTGNFMYEYEQRNVLNRDMLVVGLVALAAIIIILAIAFRSIVTPIAAMIALSCALIWTLGLARITVKSLNTVSSIFVIVLMGIGIEYGIAIISRYREERGREKSSREAFVNAMALTGKGVITGALTTAGAFFALSFSDFKAMHDMGIVLGLGVICSLLSMFFVLPAIITVKEKYFPFKPPGIPTESRLMRRVGRLVARRSVILVTVGALVTVGLGISAGFIKYESNIRAIQPEGMEVTEAQDKVSGLFGMVGDYVIIISSNEAAMREVTEDVKKLDSVRAVESLATVMPSEQLTKLVVMSRIKNKIESINPEWLEYVPPEMLTILESIGSDTLTLDKLPSDVISKYVSEDGAYATYVYPETSMYKEENAREFIDDIKTISTDISGFPVIILDTIESTRKGLSETTLFSAVAVMLMVVIDFQAILPTILALLPLLLSMIWMMGAINLMGMKFNLVNIAGAPIILGIGVDFGVYVLHRYAEEHGSTQATIPAVLAHTGRAILVSSLTVIAAFAALVLARYQGLASLGVVAAIGIAFAAISSLTILPAILRILEKRRKNRKAF